ncbi:MAG: hypothetical protein H6737_06390 [Alphaproteobacteria bacterium]|nr:hypothetical protein [Alphaproteobacteria bacterium]
MLFAWLAAAFGAPPVTWDNVTEAALGVWGDGPGAIDQASADGARRAARVVPVGPTGVRAEAQVGLAEQQQLLTAVEVPLGLGVRERRYWAGEARALEAGAEAGRWEWVQQVHAAWLDWWTAAEIAEHLAEYAADVADDVQQFQQAVDDGLLAAIALEDLRAESLTVQAEAAATEQQARVAEVRLHRYFGDRALDAGGHDLHALPEGLVNPWTELIPHAPELPPVRMAEARAEAERRRAGALVASRTPTLAVGPMWAPANDGVMRPFGYVGVSVPLQPGVASEARFARGAASAAEAEARWQAHVLQSTLEEESAAWDAARERLRRVESEVLGPLTERQERLEGALRDGLVTADRVVRARRERHEAEHEQVLVAGFLLASTARAEALSRLLEQP